MSAPDLPNVKRPADSLSFEEKLSLLEHLAQRVRMSAPGRRPQDLFGAFNGRFPQDFDVDKAVREARTAWKRDVDDGGDGAQGAP